MMTVLGIVIFFVGILFSVAWHELGHFTTARWFGIKVPEFFVGFGKTIWSRKVGETEFGFKAIPLGGYIRMIGMIPPGKGGTLGRSRRTGPFQGLMDDARQQSALDVLPQDADRQFYLRAPWKRIIVMFAGPFMNLILAVVLFAIVLMGIGLPSDGTTVGSVSACVVPATAVTPDCPPGAPATPAAAAGLRAGDRIVAFNGRELGEADGTALREAIQTGSGTVAVTVVRAGVTVPLSATLVTNEVASLDPATPAATVQAGFLGVGLLPGPYVPQDVGTVADRIGDIIGRTGEAIVGLPARVPALFRAAFLGEERDANGPLGIVGASRIGGEILAQEAPPVAELSVFLQLLAGVNISLFLFNLLPIPPLDGGQIFPAIWESIKRNAARLLGRPDPGPVDVAKLMPVAYVVAVVFIAWSGMLLIADVVNPVRLFG